MKIKFLGTGTSTGVPMIGCSCEVCSSMDYRDKRLRTSVYIETEQTRFVIDTSPDFRTQVLHHHITDLDFILFTHNHRDHLAGLDDVRPFNFLHKKEISIYASQYVLDDLKRIFSYAFSENPYPGIPQLRLHAIENKPFRANQMTILPILGLHAQLPVFGFRIHNFTYITDMNYLDNVEKEKIRDSDILVLNALQRKKHHSHFNLSQAIKIAQEVKAKQTYLTHMNHKMGLHQDVTQELPPNIHLAYDGLELEV